MNVYAIGASRNIGYFSSLRLLEKGATVTFLLRYPATFDTDEAIQRHVKSGNAHLVKGDAMNIDDVALGWTKAREHGQVDVVLFSVGATPKSGSFRLTKGFVLKPADLCTRSLLNVVRTIPSAQRIPTTQPKIIAISSIGITKASHRNLPLLLKPIYGYLAQSPHADKLGAERIAAHCAGWDWSDEEPSPDILPENFKDESGVPARGEMKRIVIVRPALLTDGECRADRKTDTAQQKPPYRISETDLGNGYTVSRQDVAHFIVEGVLKNWDRCEGKRLSIAY